MTTGERIQKARKSANMSQKELADKLGVSASMIGQYENNIRKPKIDKILSIAYILGVSASDLAEDLADAIIDDSALIGLTTDDGYVITLPKDSLEGNLLTAFFLLNNDGKAKAIERVEELTEIPKYQEKYGYYYSYADSATTEKEKAPDATNIQD